MDKLKNMDRQADGTFAVGHPGLKPRGAVSEMQKLTKQKLGEFLTLKLDDMDTIYKELSAKEKKTMILAIAEFFLPKQKELIIDQDAIPEKTTINFLALSESTLKEILQNTTITENESDNEQ